MGIIYTIGYGNRSVKEFDKVLDANRNITFIIDIRRPGCKSWNGIYGYGFPNIGLHLWESLAIPDLYYVEAPCFQNKFDTLSEYHAWIKSKDAQKHIKKWAKTIALIMKFGRGVCLLCAELEAVKDHKVNCHRVYVAEAIREQLIKLGTKCVIKHL